jgi:hypothetical protein
MKEKKKKIPKCDNLKHLTESNFHFTRQSSLSRLHGIHIHRPGEQN